VRTYVEVQMAENFKKYILEPHADYERLKAFYLKEPKHGRMGSCLILFTVEGIVIMGDLTPCQNGVISAYGYGLDWFAGQLSEDYLCSKFLTKEFVPELALQGFKERLLEKRRLSGVRCPSLDDRFIDKFTAREAWEYVEGMMQDGMGRDEYYRLYCETFNDSPECGYGYNRSDAAWLCAIQQRFSELYQAQVKIEVAAVDKLFEDHLNKSKESCSYCAAGDPPEFLGDGMYHCNGATAQARCTR
jgi:hypothetical protein